MPNETFWVMHRNIDRLMAEEDLRASAVVVYAAVGGEGLVEFNEQLRKQMGQVVVIDEKARILSAQPDREGLKELAKLGKVF